MNESKRQVKKFILQSSLETSSLDIEGSHVRGIHEIRLAAEAILSLKWELAAGDLFTVDFRLLPVSCF